MGHICRTTLRGAHSYHRPATGVFIIRSPVFTAEWASTAFDSSIPSPNSLPKTAITDSHSGHYSQAAGAEGKGEGEEGGQEGRAGGGQGGGGSPHDGHWHRPLNRNFAVVEKEATAWPVM